jgi:hypothetical protein
VTEEQHVVELYKACSQSLDTLNVESHRTLNLLALVGDSPHSTDNNAALHFQLDREKTAQRNYQRKRLELLRGLLRLASANGSRFEGCRDFGRRANITEGLESAT